MLGLNVTKSGVYPVRFIPDSSTTELANYCSFPFLASFQEILGVCQEYLHMFCRLRESIRPGSL